MTTPRVNSDTIPDSATWHGSGKKILPGSGKNEKPENSFLLPGPVILGHGYCTVQTHVTEETLLVSRES